LRSEIAAGGTSSNAYHRLNALGADAFLLQSHYGVLKSDVNPILRGHTGLLSLNEKGWVERELPLATFDRGVLRPQ
jgi:outer membrane PBP1 activator LpoA protein